MVEARTLSNKNRAFLGTQKTLLIQPQLFVMKILPTLDLDPDLQYMKQLAYQYANSQPLIIKVFLILFFKCSDCVVLTPLMSTSSLFFVWLELFFDLPNCNAQYHNWLKRPFFLLLFARVANLYSLFLLLCSLVVLA